VREDLIDGDRFEELADRLGLVYLETHDVAGYIEFIRSRTDRLVVLSHNSDGYIAAPGTPTREYDFVWHDIPPNVVHWFGQNVDVDDERLTPIPIGLERIRWHPEMHKNELILSTPRDEKTGLVYLNVNTRIRVQREVLYRYFGALPWVTVERGRNGVDFEHYARQIARHKFVLCPDGNGMDTHRTWETLYLGSFPIVERHVFTEYFARYLPLLIVDDWRQVTDWWLEQVHKDFTNREWRWAMLTMGYWEKAIREKLSE